MQELAPTDPESLRSLYSVVTLHDLKPLPGLIIYADSTTGEVILRNINTETNTSYSFGPNAIKLVRN